MISPEFQNDANSLPAVDELLRQIDQEIQTLNDKIRGLRTRRNTLAPVYHLPPEILSKIIALTIPDLDQSHRPNALDWIKISHVSKYWREFALDCPSLWVNLDFRHPEWCEEMLKRSKTAGLELKANLANMANMRLRAMASVRLALLQGHRIRSLQLRATTGELEALLSTNPLLQVPMVRSLSLATPLRSYGLFSLPQSLLDGNTPYLRQLDLRRCGIAWDIPLFNGLTSLTIHNHPSFTKPTVEQLVNTLKRMPALEILDLEDVVPSSTPGVLALHNPIYLIQLTNLTVKSTVLECVSLVSLIRIPMTARINFRCIGYDLSGILGIISNPEGTSDCSLPKRIIRALHIGTDPDDILTFKGWSASHSSRVPPQSDIQLCFSPPDDSSHDQLQSVIMDFCNAINLEHLSSLDIGLYDFSTPPIMSKRTWVDIFGALPHLHSIHVERASTETLIAALHESLPKPLTITSPERSVPTKGAHSILQLAPGQEQSNAPSLCFPYLKTLTIKGGSFGDSNTSGPKTVRLRNLIKYRSQHEAKLHELRLCQCYYLDDDEIALLGEVVKVFWDGVVHHEVMSEFDADDSYLDDDLDDDLL